MRVRTTLVLLVAGLMLAVSPQTRGAVFLDLSSVTVGGSGTGAFAGTLGSVGVTGSIISGPAPFYTFNAPGPDSSFESSTIGDSSLQYSYGSIYSPSISLTDRVGATMFGGQNGTARIQINFSQAVLNPIFHIANLDSATYDFTPTAGIGGLTLLSGNGGAGDGLQVAGLLISDINPDTLVGQSAADSPLTSGARSGYGSVQLNGTFTSLLIDVTRNPAQRAPNGDGGSFTLSIDPPTAGGSPVPLPAGVWVGAAMAVAVGVNLTFALGENIHRFSRSFP